MVPHATSRWCPRTPSQTQGRGCPPLHAPPQSSSLPRLPPLPSHSGSQAESRTQHFVSVSRFLEGHAELWMLLGRTEGFFFFPFSFILNFFLSPMNCITGQPLGFIHQTPVVFRPFPILLPLLPFQDPLAKQGRILMAGCGQGRGYVQYFSQSLPLPVLSPTPRAQTGHGPGDRDPRLL